jgi:hypothetical protein
MQCLLIHPTRAGPASTPHAQRAVRDGNLVSVDDRHSLRTRSCTGKATGKYARRAQDARSSPIAEAARDVAALHQGLPAQRHSISGWPLSCATPLRVPGSSRSELCRRLADPRTRYAVRLVVRPIPPIARALRPERRIDGCALACPRHAHVSGSRLLARLPTSARTARSPRARPSRFRVRPRPSIPHLLPGYPDRADPRAHNAPRRAPRTDCVSPRFWRAVLAVLAALACTTGCCRRRSL